MSEPQNPNPEPDRPMVPPPDTKVLIRCREGVVEMTHRDWSKAVVKMLKQVNP